jgi:AraC-like DNA-binding protein
VVSSRPTITSRFSRSFKAHYGSSPTGYRNAFRLEGAPRGASVQRPVARVQALQRRA